MERRTRIALIMGALALAALGCASAVSADVLLYNHSPSIPSGFYVRTRSEIVVGALVTVRARDVAPDAARARGFDAEGNRFIKRVAAIGGQRVCGDGDVLAIDGRETVQRYAESPTAPRIWAGCRTLRSDEVLLLGDSADSFDGRYWGPVNADLITGVWRPL
jgi:type IV secretory pathway protease TraF